MEQKKKCGYEMPTVIKYVKLELEGGLMAESVTNVKSTTIESEGQKYNSYSFTEDSGFSYTWQ